MSERKPIVLPGLAELFDEVSRNMALEDKWTATTPKVLVKTPSLARRGEKTIRIDRLGRLRAFELTTTGPRGGKETRKHFDGGAGGWGWGSVDVRLADDALLAEVADIEAQVKALDERKRALLRERFMELTPLTWDEVRNARKPWHEFHAIYEKAKEGKATVDEVRAALDRLFPKKEASA